MCNRLLPGNYTVAYRFRSFDETGEGNIIRRIDFLLLHLDCIDNAACKAAVAFVVYNRIYLKRRLFTCQ